jgi:hypothetical protein
MEARDVREAGNVPPPRAWNVVERKGKSLATTMTEQEAKLKHRLAAIMATDVVGYSKLMQSDETAALAALTEVRNATQQRSNCTKDGLPTLLAIASWQNLEARWRRSVVQWPSNSS